MVCVSHSVSPHVYPLALVELPTLPQRGPKYSILEAEETARALEEYFMKIQSSLLHKKIKNELIDVDEYDEDEKVYLIHPHFWFR